MSSAPRPCLASRAAIATWLLLAGHALAQEERPRFDEPVEAKPAPPAAVGDEDEGDASEPAALGGESFSSTAFAFEQLFEQVHDLHPRLAGVEEAELDRRVRAALELRLREEPARRERAELPAGALAGAPGAAGRSSLPAGAALDDLIAQARREIAAEEAAAMVAGGTCSELARAWLRDAGLAPEVQRERIELLMDALVDALDDPFTQVIHPSEYWRAALAESLGMPSATGVLVAPDGAAGFRIDLVLRGSDAWVKGVRKGDELLAVDGRAVRGRARFVVQEWVSQACRLRLARGGIALEEEVAIDLYAPMKGATLSALVAPDVGWVAFPLFRPGAFFELRGAIRKLEARGAKAIVLDLRGNPGGLIAEAGVIADLFVEPGRKVVDAIARRRLYETDYVTGKAAFPELPLVVLQDGSSASASEILAAALHDLGRASLVGETSYGKGIGQMALPLTYELNGDGGGFPRIGVLMLTVLDAVSPTGRAWHGTGLEPDVPVAAGAEPPQRFAARQRLLASSAWLEALLEADLDEAARAALRIEGPAPEPLLALARSAGLAPATSQDHEALKEIARALRAATWPELAACPELDPQLAAAIEEAREDAAKRGR